MAFYLFALFFNALSFSFQEKDPPSKPNIVLIFADDLGWSDIGAYGSEVETPNLNWLAANGVRFTQMYNTSKCNPSRAALMTGLYAQQVGYEANYQQPLKNATTLGEVLKSAGYRTLWAGKHHGADHPMDRGFDRYYGLMEGASNHFNPGPKRENEPQPAQKRPDRPFYDDRTLMQPYSPPADYYSTDYFTKYALKWLDEYQEEKNPFFLYLAYTAPHDPLMAWPEDIAKYKGKYSEGYEVIRQRRFEKQKSLKLIPENAILTEPTHVPWSSLSDSLKKIEAQKMEVYAAMIDRMDQKIGEIIQKLREQGKLENTDVLVKDGKIAQVGKALQDASAKIVDATGKHLSAGIIDEHSHIAISSGVNEGTQAVTSEVRIGDVLDSEDINIYRQLAGGVTTTHLLHGSANPIGGQTQLIKTRWGKTPEELKFSGWEGFIKFALGENVKQSNWGDFNTIRFPQTRMGVEQVFYDGFYRAKAYQKEWDAYRAGKIKAAPRVDLELEVLAEILRSERFITCHSYIQSEINMLMHVADSMGFRINTFTHILEGYKVADKMNKHGVAGSTFSDWWAYKFEVNDAIPYNAALMTEQGVLVCINSDDAEMGRTGGGTSMR